MTAGEPTEPCDDRLKDTRNRGLSPVFRMTAAGPGWMTAGPTKPSARWNGWGQQADGGQPARHRTAAQGHLGGGAGSAAHFNKARET